MVTPEEYARYIQNLTRARKQKKDDQAEGIRPLTESQCDVGHKPSQTHQDEEGNSGRIIISYSIFRARQLDPDNCFTKYHTDALRYEHLIKDDRDQDVEVKVRQFKSKEEYVEIEIIYP